MTERVPDISEADIWRRLRLAAGVLSLPLLIGQVPPEYVTERVCVPQGKEECDTPEEFQDRLAEEGWTSVEDVRRVPVIVSDGDCCYEVQTWDGTLGCGCAHGRPLRATRAGGNDRIRRTRTWIASDVAAPDTSSLSAAERALCGRYWASVACHEYRSIAAFKQAHRLLRSVGAPADLVAGHRSAASDEARHARLAFALASHFFGVSVGPDTRAMRAPHRNAHTLRDAAVRTVREGCLDETRSLAALLCIRAGCVDPAVRTVVDTIIEDEVAHAELAWATLRWCLDQGDASIARAVEQAFAEPATDEPWLVIPRHLRVWGCASDVELNAWADRAQSTHVEEMARRMVQASIQRTS